jgi:hypothetical protein
MYYCNMHTAGCTEMKDALYSVCLEPQIRGQMSGPDLHVFTLKILALKKLVFPP